MHKKNEWNIFIGKSYKLYIALEMINKKSSIDEWPKLIIMCVVVSVVNDT